MRVTKYYFEQDAPGLPKTEKCILLKRDFLSIECKNCDNCMGFSEVEKWVKCFVYDAITIMISQTNMISRYQENLKKREERADFLEKKLIEAYNRIQDIKDGVENSNEQGGY